MKDAFRRVVATLLTVLAPACAPWHRPTELNQPPTWDRVDSSVWEQVPLPGKALTTYERMDVDGRPVWRATADSAASMWRQRLSLRPEPGLSLEFSWKIDQLDANARLADPALDDAPARIVIAFDGDHSRLPLRDRLLFDLAESLMGERPPYATLMYVWGHDAALSGRVLSSPRTDRVRKIVVDAGAEHLGQWRRHQRDLVADFVRAFGESPGAILGLALMTDSDNAHGMAQATYTGLRLGHRRLD